MEKFFISKLHNSTKRNYLERMINDKVSCMQIAKKYGYDYWDGNRKYGYGGYKYIPGRMEKVAKQIIKTYSSFITYYHLHHMTNIVNFRLPMNRMNPVYLLQLLNQFHNTHLLLSLEQRCVSTAFA